VVITRTGEEKECAMSTVGNWGCRGHAHVVDEKKLHPFTNQSDSSESYTAIEIIYTLNTIVAFIEVIEMINFTNDFI
jgi:hypothetical protein